MVNIALHETTQTVDFRQRVTTVSTPFGTKKAVTLRYISHDELPKSFDKNRQKLIGHTVSGITWRLVVVPIKNQTTPFHNSLFGIYPPMNENPQEFQKGQFHRIIYIPQIVPKSDDNNWSQENTDNASRVLITETRALIPSDWRIDVLNPLITLWTKERNDLKLIEIAREAKEAERKKAKETEDIYT